MFGRYEKWYVPIVTYDVGRLAKSAGLDMFALRLASVFEDVASPAYILPHGNRDNDVPVVVAVSTIRKRYFTC
jgi:hypothetical protein